MNMDPILKSLVSQVDPKLPQDNASGAKLSHSCKKYRQQTDVKLPQGDATGLKSSNSHNRQQADVKLPQGDAIGLKSSNSRKPIPTEMSSFNKHRNVTDTSFTSSTLNDGLMSLINPVKSLDIPHNIKLNLKQLNKTKITNQFESNMDSSTANNNSNVSSDENGHNGDLWLSLSDDVTNVSEHTDVIRTEGVSEQQSSRITPPTSSNNLLFSPYTIVISNSSTSRPDSPDTVQLASSVIDKVKEAIDCIIKNNSRCIIIMHGPSGSGKTHLTRMFATHITSAKKSVFVGSNDSNRMVDAFQFQHSETEIISRITQEQLITSIELGYDFVISDNINAQWSNVSDLFNQSCEKRIPVIIVDLKFSDEHLLMLSTRSSIKSSDTLAIITRQHLNCNLIPSAHPIPDFFTSSVMSKCIKSVQLLPCMKYSDISNTKRSSDNLKHTIWANLSLDTHKAMSSTFYHLLKRSNFITFNRVSFKMSDHNIELEIAYVTPPLSGVSDDTLYHSSDFLKRYARRGIVFNLTGSAPELVCLGMRKFCAFNSNSSVHSRYIQIPNHNKPFSLAYSHKYDGEAFFVSAMVDHFDQSMYFVFSTKKATIPIKNSEHMNLYSMSHSGSIATALIKAATQFINIIKKDKVENLKEWLIINGITLVFESLAEDFTFKVTSSPTNSKLVLLGVVSNECVLPTAPSTLSHSVKLKTISSFKSFITNKSINNVVAFADTYSIQKSDISQTIFEILTSKNEGCVISIITDNGVEAMIKVKSVFYQLMRRFMLRINSVFDISSQGRAKATYTQLSIAKEIETYVIETILTYFNNDDDVKAVCASYVNMFNAIFSKYEQASSPSSLSFFLMVSDIIDEYDDLISLSQGKLRDNVMDILAIKTVSENSSIISNTFVVEQPEAQSQISKTFNTNANASCLLTFKVPQSDAVKINNAKSVKIVIECEDGQEQDIYASIYSHQISKIDVPDSGDNRDILLNTINATLKDQIDAAAKLLKEQQTLLKTVGLDDSTLSAFRNHKVTLNPHCLQTSDAKYSKDITHHVSEHKSLEYVPHDNRDKTTPINTSISQINAAVNAIDRSLMSIATKPHHNFRKLGNDVNIYGPNALTASDWKQCVRNDLRSSGIGRSNELRNMFVNSEELENILEPPLLSTAGYVNTHFARKVIIANPHVQTITVLTMLYPYINFVVFSNMYQPNSLPRDQSAMVEWIATSDVAASLKQHLSDSKSRSHLLISFLPDGDYREHPQLLCKYLCDMFFICNNNCVSNLDAQEDKLDCKLVDYLVEFDLPSIDDTVKYASDYQWEEWRLFPEKGTLSFLRGELILPIFSKWRSTSMFLFSSRSRDITTYNISSFLNVLYYYNVITRSTPHVSYRSIPGFDHCHDCTTFLNTIDAHAHLNTLFKYTFQASKFMDENKTSKVKLTRQINHSENLNCLVSMILSKLVSKQGTINIPVVINGNYGTYNMKSIHYGITKNRFNDMITYNGESSSQNRVSKACAINSIRKLINDAVYNVNAIKTVDIDLSQYKRNPYHCDLSPSMHTIMPVIFLKSWVGDFNNVGDITITANTGTIKYASKIAFKSMMIPNKQEKAFWDTNPEINFMVFEVLSSVQDYHKNVDNKVWEHIIYVASTELRYGIQYAVGSINGKKFISGIFDRGGAPSFNDVVISARSIDDIMNIIGYMYVDLIDSFIAGSIDPTDYLWHSTNDGTTRIEYTSDNRKSDVLYGSSIIDTLHRYSEDKVPIFNSNLDIMRPIYQHTVQQVIDGRLESTLDIPYMIHDGSHTRAMHSMGFMWCNAIPKYLTSVLRSVSRYVSDNPSLATTHMGYSTFKSIDGGVIYSCERCGLTYTNKLASVTCNAFHAAIVNCISNDLNGNELVKTIKVYDVTTEVFKNRTLHVTDHNRDYSDIRILKPLYKGYLVPTPRERPKNVYKLCVRVAFTSVPERNNDVNFKDHLTRPNPVSAGRDENGKGIRPRVVTEYKMDQIARPDPKSSFIDKNAYVKNSQQFTSTSSKVNDYNFKGPRSRSKDGMVSLPPKCPAPDLESRSHNFKTFTPSTAYYNAQNATRERSNSRGKQYDHYNGDKDPKTKSPSLYVTSNDQFKTTSRCDVRTTFRERSTPRNKNYNSCNCSNDSRTRSPSSDQTSYTQLDTTNQYNHHPRRQTQRNTKSRSRSRSNSKSKNTLTNSCTSTQLNNNTTTSNLQSHQSHTNAPTLTGRDILVNRRLQKKANSTANPLYIPNNHALIDPFDNKGYQVRNANNVYNNTPR